MLLSSLQEAFDEPLKDGFDIPQRHNPMAEKFLNFDKLDGHKDKMRTEALERYTSSGAFDINRELWNNKLYNSKLHNHDEDIHDIQKAIHSTEPATENHTLYTGIRDTILKRGDIIHSPSFTSTSLDPEIAYRFAEGKKYLNNGIKHTTILKIQARKGQKMLNADDYAILRSEREVILPANQLLKIKSTKIYTDSIDRPIHVHTAQIMTPDEIKEHLDHPEVQSYLRMKKDLNL